MAHHYWCLVATGSNCLRSQLGDSFHWVSFSTNKCSMPDESFDFISIRSTHQLMYHPINPAVLLKDGYCVVYGILWPHLYLHGGNVRERSRDYVTIWYELLSPCFLFWFSAWTVNEGNSNQRHIISSWFRRKMTPSFVLLGDIHVWWGWLLVNAWVESRSKQVPPMATRWLPGFEW